MLKIGVDFSALDPKFKRHSIRGIGRYARELSQGFDAQSLNNGIALDSFNHQEIFQDSLLSKLIDYMPAGRQTLKQQILYPMKLNSTQLAEFDVLHFLAQTDAPSWSKKPYILTVMDIIPIVCADLYQAEVPNWRYKLARYLELQAIKNASLILTISENSKKDLVEYLEIDPDKIIVTPLGVNQQYFTDGTEFAEVKKKYNLKDRPFMLSVGGIDPRKNVVGLLNVYRKVLDCLRERNAIEEAPLLYFAGQINHEREYPKFKAAIKELELEDWVNELGFVDDQDLITLYRNCSAFCFLSLYEGFGLTPLEAMAAGAPVVSSNTSAMPEVLGDAACMCSPEDQEQLADSVVNLLCNRELREEYSKKGTEQAKKFNWSKTVDLTLGAYQTYHEARSNS